MKPTLKKQKKSENLSPMAILAQRELATRHLSDFIKQNFPKYQENWHHKKIISALEEVDKGNLKRLMVSMPPRHGKSEICSIQLPAWYIGRHPKAEIIACSYSADLSVEFGRKTRNLVNSQEYQNIFSVKLAEDSKSAGKWNTSQKGAYIATGVGGSITGKGADCIAEGEMVETIKGPRRIESIKSGDLVLSYNERTKHLEYKKVQAVRCISDRNIISLAGRIKCTPDHRIYDGSQYIQANKCQKVYALLPSALRVLRKDFRETFNRVEKEKAYKILLPFVLAKIRIRSLAQALSGVWCKDEEGGEIHLSSVQRTVSEKREANKKVSALQCFIQGASLAKQILFSGVQGYVALRQHAWSGKPELETRKSKFSLQSIVQNYRKANTRERQAEMWTMQEEGQMRSPHRRRQAERQTRKSNYGMSCVSHGHAQVQKIQRPEIKKAGKAKVYDLQVEDNKNFFVNGILVHNCLIIDDPIKNREEAESALTREKIYDWYRSTAYTRLNPEGAIIIIQTRWHDDDLMGKLERQKEEEWHIISLPAIATEDEKERDKGEALWPQRYSIHDLRRIQGTVGSYDFSSLYQQNPIDESTQEFKKQYFKEIEWSEVAKKQTRNFLTVDTAISKKATGDYTAFVRNYVDQENNWHFKTHKLKIGPHEVIETLFRLFVQDKFEKIGIEETVYFQAIKPFLDDEMKKRGMFLPIVPVKHGHISKELRIRALLPRYEAGTIFHIVGECKNLEEELIRFPKSRHDDIMDAAAYHVHIAKQAHAQTETPFKETTFDPYNKQDRDTIFKGVNFVKEFFEHQF